MTNPFQPTISVVQFLPGDASHRQKKLHDIYEANRRRVYSFAFWMTDSELKAEEILERTFFRAFSIYGNATEEQIDQVLVRQLKTQASITFGAPQLRCAPVQAAGSVRHNTLRVDLECALLELPHTERMIYCMHDGEGYTHERIARTLGITESESRDGLHQARLRIRELLALQQSPRMLA